jgi:carboxypeptidase family protein
MRCPVNVIVLLLLTSFAAARCPAPSWIVDDDRIDGIVSKDGQPLKHATVQLFSPAQQYSAITDEKGAFLIRGIAVGKYSFAVKGWGEAYLDVRGWHRGALNRPVLLFSSMRRCLLLTVVAN